MEIPLIASSEETNKNSTKPPLKFRGGLDHLNFSSKKGQVTSNQAEKCDNNLDVTAKWRINVKVEKSVYFVKT